MVLVSGTLSRGYDNGHTEVELGNKVKFVDRQCGLYGVGYALHELSASIGNRKGRCGKSENEQRDLEPNIFVSDWW